MTTANVSVLVDANEIRKHEENRFMKKNLFRILHKTASGCVGLGQNRPCQVLKNSALTSTFVFKDCEPRDQQTGKRVTDQEVLW